MARFRIEEIVLDIPDGMLVPGLRRALEAGRYEGRERQALRRHLRRGDRLLELGTGVGCLAALSAGIIGADRITTVEANPLILEVARANLDRNGAGAVRLIHGAAVPDAMAGGTIPFHVHPGFWSASLAPNPKLPTRRHDVLALGFHALLAETGANAVVMDVEGAEEILLDVPPPPAVRLVVLEVHSARYDASVIAQMRESLVAAGLCARHEPPEAEVWVHERPDSGAP